MSRIYSVHITPQAAADLKELFDVAVGASESAALGVCERILEAIDRLQELPNRHGIQQVGRRRASLTVRRIPVLPFVIYYRVIESE